MTNSKLILVPLIAVTVLATPAMARTSHVTPSVSSTAHHFNGPVGIRVLHVRTFAPPSDAGTCDVGDNPHVC